MISLAVTTMAASVVARGVRHWIFHLGGLGFIPLGLLDGSVVPVPGSMDVLNIVLSARQPDLWPYYAAMATIGSVIGSLVTYRLARKGGQEALAKRRPKGKPSVRLPRHPADTQPLEHQQERALQS